MHAGAMQVIRCVEVAARRTMSDSGHDFLCNAMPLLSTKHGHIQHQITKPHGCSDTGLGVARALCQCTGVQKVQTRLGRVGCAPSSCAEPCHPRPAWACRCGPPCPPACPPTHSSPARAQHARMITEIGFRGLGQGSPYTPPTPPSPMPIPSVLLHVPTTKRTLVPCRLSNLKQSAPKAGTRNGMAASAQA